MLESDQRKVEWIQTIQGARVETIGQNSHAARGDKPIDEKKNSC